MTNLTENAAEIAILNVEGFSLPKAFVSALHASTIGSLAFYSYTMYRRVSIDHPVFRLIFQEIVVLSLIEGVSYLCLLFLMADNFYVWYHLANLVGYMGNQFHQVTWLFVTSLRFHLLCVKSKGEEVDMVKLRRRCQFAIWPAFFSTNLLGGLQLALMNKRLGYPEVQFIHLSPARQFVELIQLQIVLNLPDVASVVIYLVMLARFKKRQQQVAAVLPLPEDGGVFPGDGNISISSSAEQDVPFGGGITPPFPQPAADDSKEASEHEEKSVLKTLGTHAVVSLLDMTFTLQVFIPDKNVKAFSFMCTNVIVAFWVPMYVAKRNFKAMDNMAKNCFLTFC